jgi:hypothetical protein
MISSNKNKKNYNFNFEINEIEVKKIAYNQNNDFLNNNNLNNNNPKSKEKQNNKNIIIENKSKYQIVCMHCFEETSITDNNIIYEDIVCEKRKCEFSIIDCFHCKRVIYLGKLSEEEFIAGNTIKCPYIDCEEYFFYLMCPNSNCEKFCIINGKYEEFKEYECPYICKENNEKIRSNNKQLIISYRCLNNKCNKTLFLKKEDFESGSYDLCEDCKDVFIHFNCNKCNKNNIIPSNLNFENEKNFKINKDNEIKDIKCPEENCQERFKFVDCPFCQSLKIINNNEFLFGKNFECDNFNCSEFFHLNFCPDCKIIKFIEGKNNNNFLTCPNEKNKNKDKDEDDNSFCLLSSSDCNKAFNFYFCKECKSQECFFIKSENENYNQNNLNSKFICCKNNNNKNQSDIKGIKIEFINNNNNNFKKNFNFSNFEKKLKKLENDLMMIYKSLFINNKKKNENQEFEFECSICETNPKNVIYAPCGHLINCFKCYERLKINNQPACPICKIKIESYVLLN